MFYEEQIINGVLCFRNTPNGEWNEFTIQQLSDKCVDLKRANYFYSQNCYDLAKLIFELKKDANYLAIKWQDEDAGGFRCHHCGCFQDTESEEWHDVDCPIQFHNDLMKSIED